MTGSNCHCQESESNLFSSHGSAPSRELNSFQNLSQSAKSESSVFDLALLRSDIERSIDGRQNGDLERLLTSKTHDQIEIGSLSETAEHVAPKTVKGQWKYRIHRAMRLAKVIPQDRAYICLSGGISADKVRIVKDYKKKVHKSGIVRCNLTWACSNCRQIALHEKRQQLRFVTEKSKSDLIMLTLTMPHSRSDRLVEMMGTLKKAWNRFRNDRQLKEIQSRYGYDWGVSTIEVTHGKNGFHPHLHVLFGLKDWQSKALESVSVAIQEIWVRVCDAFRNNRSIATSNVHATRVTEVKDEFVEYVAKWSIYNEITDSSQMKKGKNGNKSIAQIELEATEEYEKTGRVSRSLFLILREYYEAMTGMKFMNPIGRFNEYLKGFKSDDVESEIEEGTVTTLEENEDEDGRSEGPDFEIENLMEIEIRPSFWNRTLLRNGIAQELLMMVEIEDTVKKIRSFLIERCQRVMKSVPLSEIVMMVDFNCQIWGPLIENKGDFEADFSAEKCNEKFAVEDIRLVA